MSKVLIIKGYGQDNHLGKLVLDKLNDFFNDINISDLDENEIKSCTGCDYCQKINPGICCMNDKMGAVLSEYLESELVFIISPISFGCINTITKNFIDRTEPLFLPYQVKKKKRIVMMPRYDKYPKLIFVVLTDKKNESEITSFQEIVINSNLSLTSPEVKTVILSCEDDLVFLIDAKEGMV